MRVLVVAAMLTACSFEHGSLGGTAGSDGSTGDGNGVDAVSAAWKYRRTLTIDNTGLGELSDFTVAVILDATRITYASTATGGADLRFTAGDGTGLAYEIEQWNPAGTSVVWVRVPSIAANTSTTISMYYGNLAAAAGAMPVAAWDQNFVGVWHMVDAHDSTGHSTSTNVGATPATGKVGPALSFAGAQYVDTGDATDLAAWTIEVWMNPATASVATGASSPISRYPDYMILWSCNGATFCHKVMFQGSDVATHIADYTISTGVWSQVVGRFDGTSLRSYVNGTMVGQEVTADPPLATTYTAKIGTRMDLAGYFVGGIDEVRISRVGRSDDYIRAQVRSTTDTYITYGAQQSN